MAYYDYRAVDPVRDQIITDAISGTVIGIRTHQGMQLLNGITDKASSLGGGLTTVSGRDLVISDAAQAVVFGGTTISSGSVTCEGTGEFVTLPY